MNHHHPPDGDAPIVLLLGHDDDPVAAQIEATLWHPPGGGPRRVRPVSLDAGDLVHAVGWEWHDPFAADSMLHVPGTGPIRLADVGAVLNRLQWIPAPPFPESGDRDYAAAELFALLIAWLGGLDAAVLNRPTPVHLSGPKPTQIAVQRAAAAAGLGAQTVRFVHTSKPDTTDWVVQLAPSDRAAAPVGHDPRLPLGERPARLYEPADRALRVDVVAGCAFGAPPDLARAVARFACRLGFDLCRVSLVWSIPRQRWVVLDVDGMPGDLRAGAIDRLATVLGDPANHRPAQTSHPEVVG